jgi:glycolate oxidase
LCFDSPQLASDATGKIFAAGLMPCMVEMVDATALGVVRPISSFGIPEGIGAALLVQTDGAEGQAMEDLLRLCEVAVDVGARDVVVAQNEKTREGIRRSRRLVSGCLKEKYPFKLSDDIAVPRSRMSELLLRSQEEADKDGMHFCAYGHMGDGNLHVNLLCSQETRAQAEICRTRIMSIAVGMGGTISGEHGIGIAKSEHLPMEQGKPLIDFQRELKSVFDPKGIMNPKKIFI